MTGRFRARQSRWARGVAYALVAVALGLATLQFRHRARLQGLYHQAAARRSKSLAAELAHCQAIGMAAAQSRQCLAAWKTEQNHFFSYRPAHADVAAATTTTTSDLPTASAMPAKAALPKPGVQ